MEPSVADKLCHKNINNNEEERVTVTAAKVTSVTARMGGRVTKVGTTIANYCQLLPTVANFCQLSPPRWGRGRWRGWP